MDYESPDVMKDFPGLYASDACKRGSNDSDYSDEADKLAKKDLLGKRKEKKDKKDKERGYAALEGESSAEENEARSPSKLKKTKAFKFSTKSKEKREKSREKDGTEKKKEKEKKNDKRVEKEKGKLDKRDKKFKSTEDYGDLADGLPIFGASLDDAVQRSHCHDNVNIPLPVRACIDYVQTNGLTMEYVYKISGPKSKVIQLRKLYNQREPVDLSEYDVPTATSLLKMYLRDLPEPIFTNDLLIRFEEAGAILNVGTREKHLKTLTENLPPNNHTLLAWLLIHFDNVVLNERHNKMNIQHVVAALGTALHTSHRLLTALIHHCRALFPTTILETYIPPLTSTSKLPEDFAELETELEKQESLLSQIHSEMNAGFITKTREELLWEVQRIITQLKRKIKNLQKDREAPPEVVPEPPKPAVVEPEPEPEVEIPIKTSEPEPEPASDNSESSQITLYTENLPTTINGNTEPEPDKSLECKRILENCSKPYTDDAVALLHLKKTAMLELKERLIKNIEFERNEVMQLKKQLQEVQVKTPIPVYNDSNNLDEVMDLLHKENQILEIKKMNLVRNIMEEEEECVDLKAMIDLLSI